MIDSKNQKYPYPIPSNSLVQKGDRYGNIWFTENKMNLYEITEVSQTQLSFKLSAGEIKWINFNVPGIMIYRESKKGLKPIAFSPDVQGLLALVY